MTGLPGWNMRESGFGVDCVCMNILRRCPIEEDGSIEVLKEEEEEEAAANSLLTETQPGICPYRKVSCSSTPVAEDASHLPEGF